jgi:hypothetical protein
MTKSLTGMLRITAYNIPEVDNALPPPQEKPTMGCPFLDSLSIEEAREVLRAGIFGWHPGEHQWREFIDRLLAAVADAPPAPPSMEGQAPAFGSAHSPLRGPAGDP